MRGELAHVGFLPSADPRPKASHGSRGAAAGARAAPSSTRARPVVGPIPLRLHLSGPPELPPCGAPILAEGAARSDEGIAPQPECGLGGPAPQEPAVARPASVPSRFCARDGVVMGGAFHEAAGPASTSPATPVMPTTAAPLTPGPPPRQTARPAHNMAKAHPFAQPISVQVYPPPQLRPAKNSAAPPPPPPRVPSCRPGRGGRVLILHVANQESLHVPAE